MRYVWHSIAKPTSTSNQMSVYKGHTGSPHSFHSGLPSERINLSPFTKDFRGGGHTMSLLWICCLALSGGLTQSKQKICCMLAQKCLKHLPHCTCTYMYILSMPLLPTPWASSPKPWFSIANSRICAFIEIPCTLTLAWLVWLESQSQNSVGWRKWLERQCAVER